MKVEKALQRFQQGQHAAMYVTLDSIEKRAGDTTSWRELLLAVGFRFEPETDQLPPAIYFPASDPGDRLQQCSACLQALLSKLID
jgi:hypothetical protein